MQRKLRQDHLVSYYLRMILPKPITQLIVRLKGTGTLEHPREVLSENRDSLACTIAYNKYGSFCTPNSYRYDEPIQYTYRGEQYEAESVEHIQTLNLDGDIIHAGAYFGDSIPGLAKALKGSAKLWAFEPNPESYRCAEITVLLNALKNVELKNCGLGSQEGTLNLQIKAPNGGRNLGGTSRIVSEANETTEVVQVKRLDDVIPPDRKIALIHLDVEGFESEVLEGAARIIEKHSPLIIIEVSHAKAGQDLLKNFGYEFVVGLDEMRQYEGFRNALFKKVESKE